MQQFPKNGALAANVKCKFCVIFILGKAVGFCGFDQKGLLKIALSS